VDLLIEATRRAEERHFWFRGFRRFVRPLLGDATAGMRCPRLLDCGCGTGFNLAMLGEFGETTGIDFNWLGLQYARRLGATRVARATVASLPFPDASFDVLTSFDVLVCLDEAAERQAIAEMWRVLRPGGAVVLNVAALNALRGNHSVLSEEVRRYDRRRLRWLFGRAGFRIERLTYTNFTLFPLLLVVRCVQRAIGLKPPEEAHREVTVPPGPINTALTAALGLEARLVRRVTLPAGSSLLCLARKP
jgi:SAM-dependent methyltransferase